MAKLNEPSVADEAVENLKRRFLRQNREIARVNSAQSIRIKTLDVEVARLVSKTFTLEQENIHLRHEVEKRAKDMATEKIQNLKDKVAEQMQSMQQLLSSWQEEPLQPKRAPRTQESKDSGSSYVKHSSRSEVVLSLGAIAEESEMTEFSGSSQNQEEEQLEPGVAAEDIHSSPELGSPPTSLFALDEGLNDVTQHSPLAKQRMNNDTRDQDLTATSPEPQTNTRKRRRDADGRNPMRRKSELRTEPMIMTARIVPSTIALKPELASSRTTRISVLNESELKLASPGRRTDNMRQPLGAKSVNRDPRFEAKKQARRDAIFAKLDLEKPAEPAISQIDPVKKDTVRSPEKIDVSSEVASAALSRTSATRGMTPSEQSFTNTTGTAKDALDRISLDTRRPSRASRGAVSYAEPSLRDKMRRPTGELVDAVMPTAAQSKALSQQIAETGVDSRITEKPTCDASISSADEQGLKLAQQSQNENPHEVEKQDLIQERPLCQDLTTLGQRVKLPGLSKALGGTGLERRHKRRSAMLLSRDHEALMDNETTLSTSIISSRRTDKVVGQNQAVEDKGERQGDRLSELEAKLLAQPQTRQVLGRRRSMMI